MKVHFYLFHYKRKKIREILHCPLDSVVLEEGLKKNEKLIKINITTYKKRQSEIEKIVQKDNKFKIDFDKIWDERILTVLA